VKSFKSKKFTQAIVDSKNVKYLLISRDFPSFYVTNLKDIDFDEVNSIVESLKKSGLQNIILGQLINKKLEGDFSGTIQNYDGFYFYAFINEGTSEEKFNQIFSNLEVKNKVKQFIYWKEIENSSNLLLQCLGKKDSYTAGHTKRVGSLCEEIARKKGLSDYDVKVCFYSGLLHDVGKIGINDTILKKNSALSDVEFNEMKAHPQISFEILKNHLKNKDIINGVRFHHEKFDGSGYPVGLSGEEIPLAARIVSVADTFDALISHRPYRKGIHPLEAIEKIKKIAPGQLDEDIVGILIKYVESSQMGKKTKKAA